jgi:GDP-4-dehydro-6-deoxy-D-mannose reductase
MARWNMPSRSRARARARPPSPLRVLITGASGFAGGYLAHACAQAGDEVIGVSRSGVMPTGGGDGRAVDLRDGAAVRTIFQTVRPQLVFHLAALSSVSRSWEDPATTVQDNVSTAVNVLEALRHEAPDARAVWVSSCEVYGTAAQLPIEEQAPLQPANPYAVSKTAGDLLAGVYADFHGLDIVRARPFNHAGPGQRAAFIVSSLAQQAAEGRVAGAQRIRIVTGNPETRRDFTDVRDVARAYRLLAERASRGTIYNVSSGQSISPADQVRLLAEIVAPVVVEHSVDPTRVRAHEVMDLRGANDRIRSATGWEPQIPFRQTMLDTLEWWERELSGIAPVSCGRP